MPDARELVRAAHNAAANSADDAEASTRPAHTPAAELRRMQKDVVAKLDVWRGMSVLEIGCGTGLLAIPLARLAHRFLGVDFAENALAVTARRLHEAGLDSSASVANLDFIDATDDQLAALGTFDRVLVYSVLHYAADDDQAREFVHRALRLVRTGGLAMFGNLPLLELRDEVVALQQGGRAARVRSRLRWLLTNDTPLPRTTRWKLGGFPYRVWLRMFRVIRRGRDFEPVVVVSGSLVSLSIEKLEKWLATAAQPVSYRWEVPRIGTPMFVVRGDLLVKVGPSD